MERESIVSMSTYPATLSQHSMALDAGVSLMEMKKTFFDLGPNKAPGEDGFPALFYLKCWEVVSSNLMNFINDVWNNLATIAPVNNLEEGKRTLEKYKTFCMISVSSNPASSCVVLLGWGGRATWFPTRLLIFVLAMSFMVTGFFIYLLLFRELLTWTSREGLIWKLRLEFLSF